MTDQKTSSADRKDPSAPPVALDAEKRRRMREAAEAAAREAPGEWRTGEKGPPFFRGFSAVTCDVEDDHGLDHRVLLTHNHHFEHEACARFAVEAQPSAVLALLDALEQAEHEALKPLEWADVCRLQDEVDALNARGADRGELTRAEADLRAAKAVWGLDEHERAAR
ncbi:ead/Ea22-like family protein [Sorangium sp. So ce388]|uniref:ead/Ea22-like family protein n=1 Tax=Sorangium sp. So ce388 TaxID=3133309 RepID=UPI003F5B3FB6